MSPSSPAGRASSAVLLAGALLLLDACFARHGLLAGEGAEDGGTARLALAGHRYAVARAIRGAAQQLRDGRCQALLDEFADASGRPLRAALEAQGLALPEYLDRVFFYDAPEWACRGGNLAITRPGNRAIFVCGARFEREVSKNSRNPEAIVIHELLHSLGLGENPPTSDYITARVRSRCGRGGSLARVGAGAPATRDRP